jgi:hypothetical protein
LLGTTTLPRRILLRDRCGRETFAAVGLDREGLNVGSD